MDNNLLISSIAYGIFYAFCLYFLHKYRYDQNAFYKGRYLLYQEMVFSFIHTESSILISYQTTRNISIIASYAFIISHNAFYITYFLYLYRMIILNKIEFGKLHTSEYPKIHQNLKPSWSIKITIIFTLIISAPDVIIFALYSSQDVVYKFLTFESEDPKIQAYTYYNYTIIFLEYLSYCWLYYYSIRARFRLTIKIDLFLNLLIWGVYYSCRFSVPLFINFSILLPLRNLCLNMSIIISFQIRNHFVKIPDPPIFFSDPYIFIYEHKMFYITLHEFLKTFDDKKYLDYLELGLYISMYRFQSQKHHLLLINTSCQRLGLPQFDDPLFIKTEICIKDSIEYIFADFFSSVYYGYLCAKLSAHSTALYL